ncbi:4502_t:CDS:1, partial [Ambispora gerdemannii]
RLPPLSDLILFYYGYPKHRLIIEAAYIVIRIEHGEWVSDHERWSIRSKLGVEICRIFPPGSLDYLSWQALVDLWRRIPDCVDPPYLSPSTNIMRTAVV